MNFRKSPYITLTVFLCLGLTIARPHKGNDMLDVPADVNKGLEENRSGFNNGGSGSGTGTGYGWTGPYGPGGQPCMKPKPLPQPQPQPCPINDPCEPLPQPCPIEGSCQGVSPGIEVPGIQIPGIEIPMPDFPIIEPEPTVPGPCSPQVSCPPQCCQQYATNENANATVTESKYNAIPNNGAIMGASEPDVKVDSIPGPSSPRDQN